MADYKFTFQDLYDLISDDKVPTGKDLMLEIGNLGIFVYAGKRQVNIIKRDKNGLSLSICNICFYCDERRDEDSIFTIHIFECPRDGYCDYSHPKAFLKSSDVITDLSEGLWDSIRYGKTVEGVLLMLLTQRRIITHLYSES